MGLKNTGMVDRPKVVTSPSTNRAGRSLTFLMWPTLQRRLPWRQISHQHMFHALKTTLLCHLVFRLNDCHVVDARVGKAASSSTLRPTFRLPPTTVSSAGSSQPWCRTWWIKTTASWSTESLTRLRLRWCSRETCRKWMAVSSVLTTSPHVRLSQPIRDISPL